VRQAGIAQSGQQQQEAFRLTPRGVRLSGGYEKLRPREAGPLKASLQCGERHDHVGACRLKQVVPSRVVREVAKKDVQEVATGKPHVEERPTVRAVEFLCVLFDISRIDVEGDCCGVRTTYRVQERWPEQLVVKPRRGVGKHGRIDRRSEPAQVAPQEHGVSLAGLPLGAFRICRRPRTTPGDTPSHTVALIAVTQYGELPMGGCGVWSRVTKEA